MLIIQLIILYVDISIFIFNIYQKLFLINSILINSKYKTFINLILYFFYKTLNFLIC